MDGLTDEEYFWEPVPGCWNIRPRGTSTAPIQAGGGAFTIDFAFPEPDPRRSARLRGGWVTIVGVLGARTGNHFGDRTIDYQTFDYAGTAAGASRQLDEVYASWMCGARGVCDAVRHGDRA